MKFKFTWGHGMVVVLGIFMVFILTLIFSAGNMGSLVTDDYYKKELKFQDQIDAMQRAEELTDKPEISKTTDGIKIQFPLNDPFQKSDIELIRFSDKSLDRNYSVELQKDWSYVIPKSDLTSGIYKLNLSWSKNKVNYLIEEEIEW